MSSTLRPCDSNARHLLAALMLLWMLLPGGLNAELLIRITEGRSEAVPIAVVPFGNPENADPPEALSSIIRDDLQMSGQFDPLKPTRMLSLPASGDEIFYRDWRLLGQKYLVVGSFRPLEGGSRFELRYELYDVNRQLRLLGEKLTAGRNSLRQLAHRVSDRVYEAVTGIRGAFSTRLAFVTKAVEDGEAVYRLQVSDVDGQRAQVLLKSPEPIMSPEWSPDGRQLAYVSFEEGRPMVYSQTVATGERRIMARFRGINSAPAWSPDGRSMLMTLSKDGNAEVYQMSLADGSLKRLTRHWAIDTEPVWAPNGSRFVFTSDRSGGPQLYIQEIGGGEPRRLTFEGRYNAGAAFSPDGERIYYVHQRDGDFHIAQLELSTGTESVLTRTRLDETPSPSPNGQMLIYATQQGKNSVLAVISSTGGTQYTLPAKFGDVREPAWSPFLD